MKSKFALAAVLCSGLLFALGGSTASAATVTPKQAAAKCRSARSNDAAAFRSRFGPGKKAVARCVSTKVSLADLLSQVGIDPGQLPDLSQLPPLPPQACDAINSALAQVSQLNLTQLLNFQLPSLPAGALPPAVMAQLGQLQAVLTQLQTMLFGQLGVLQGLIQAQLDALLSQVQAQLATVCPTG